MVGSFTRDSFLHQLEKRFILMHLLRVSEQGWRKEGGEGSFLKRKNRQSMKKFSASKLMGEFDHFCATWEVL